MLTALTLAVPVAAGAPWAVVGALGLVVVRPWWAAGLLALWGVAGLVRRGDDAVELEARLLDAVAAELRTGAVWRTALVSAAARVPGLDLEKAAVRCRAGLSVDRVAPAIRQGLPHLGRPAAAALRLVATSGGPAAAVFAALAGRASQHAAEANERRVATAQARLSAILVGGTPVVVAGALLATGRAEAALAAGAAGGAVLGLGGALVVSGALVVFAMLRAAAR